jgi:hypothetical protein
VNLQDARENYYFYTGKASDLARYLGFAGLGLIWIFATELTDQQRIPTSLVPAAIFIVIGLALDLLQYLVAGASWGIFQRVKERQLTQARVNGEAIEEDFEAPDWINWPTIFFYWSKMVAMATAYFYILTFLVRRLF